MSGPRLVNDNGLANLDWAYALLDALAAGGVRHVVLSPGSRSTPLALAANRHAGLVVTVMIDERSAGFHALGLAKGSGRPVALVCTSGTAATNYHPALAEARASGVPLVALTADRPPRLRGLGAPQTIDQVRLYGPTTAYAELAVAVADPAARRAMATRVALALAEACTAPAGPVQLNVPFDEPLAPSRDALLAWTPTTAPAPRVAPGRVTAAADALAAVAARLAAARRPVLFAGPEAAAHGAGEALLEWAAAAGMPVVADVGSGLRAFASAAPYQSEGRASRAARAADDVGATIACHADLYLRPAPVAGASLLGVQPGASPTARAAAYGPAELVPDLLVMVGGGHVSKAVTTWAVSSGAEAIALWPDAHGRDPDALASLVVLGDVADAAERLTELVESPADLAWCARWQAFEARAAAAIRAGDPPVPAEAQAVRAAAAALPAGGILALSNSLPIRHADGYAGPGVRSLVFRGANGIDGVTAASLGAAVGADAPLVLVTGDLAFLHDLGGLAAARAVEAAGGRAVVLVLDNDGGAIFNHLPISGIAPDFEALWGTPQSRDLPVAAQLFGLPCAVARTADEVGAAVAAGLAAPGVSVVVFPSDRPATVAEHRAFVAAVARQAVGHG